MWPSEMKALTVLIFHGGGIRDLAILVLKMRP